MNENKVAIIDTKVVTLSAFLSSVSNVSVDLALPLKLTTETLKFELTLRLGCLRTTKSLGSSMSSNAAHERAITSRRLRSTTVKQADKKHD